MQIKSKSIKYDTNGDSISAYLAQPDDSEKHGGIILIHAIFGLDDHIKDVANRLASEGYIVLAPDLFSSKKLSPVLTKENIREAMKFMMSIPSEKQRDSEFRAKELEKSGDNSRKAVVEVNDVLFANRPIDLFVQYLSSGIDYIASLKNLNGKVGSMGFCFGGGLSISLACRGRTDATVIFYGENPKPIEQIKGVKGAVMGLYGGEDVRINIHLHELVKELAENKIPFTVKTYPGARHAFFDDTSAQTYNKDAAEDSWQMVRDFFRKHIK